MAPLRPAGGKTIGGKGARGLAGPAGKGLGQLGKSGLGGPKRHR